MKAVQKLNGWHPASWRGHIVKQMPAYEDPGELDNVLIKLKQLPPISRIENIKSLKRNLSKVSKGEAYLLHAGDCAESFAEMGNEKIESTINLINQLAEILADHSQKPVVKIGRIAGQYAKPRSFDTETKGYNTLPIYKGDMVNGFAFEEDLRAPNPERIYKAYAHSAIKYGQINGRVYTSHDGLHLGYEEAMTRKHEGAFYCQSADLLWASNSTRFLGSAHIEYLRGIKNPIAFKLGSKFDPKEILELIGILNPDNKHGRLVMICRFGLDKISEAFPKIIEKTRDRNIIWCCDPMHGNTERLTGGYKTRSLFNITRELKQFIEIAKRCGVNFGGVHLEITSDNVTECIGGSKKVTYENLLNNYKTLCDPRLNKEQALEVIRKGIINEHWK